MRKGIALPACAALALLASLNLHCGSGSTHLAEPPFDGLPPPSPSPSPSPPPPIMAPGTPAPSLVERPVDGPPPPATEDDEPGEGSVRLAEHPGDEVELQTQGPRKPRPPGGGPSLAERPAPGPRPPVPPSRNPALAEHPVGPNNGVPLVPPDPGPPARQRDNKAAALIQEANGHWQSRAYARAEPLFREAIEQLERAPERNPVAIATTQNSLAQIYRELGDYARAEPLAAKAFATLEKALGPDHLTTADAEDNLAWLCWQRGDFARAEHFAEHAFAVRERAFKGKASTPLIASLSTLGVLRWDRGDYARAGVLLTRARDMAEKLSPAAAPMITATLNNLGGLTWDKGDYARAEPLFARALSLRETALGKEDVSLAVPLSYLARAALEREDFDRAEELFARARVIWEKALGKEHPHVAHALADLGELYRTRGDHARAEPLLVEALRINERVFGKGHPAVGDCLDELATLHREMGAYARARPLAERALSIFRASHGDMHPNVGKSLNHLALLSLAEGDIARAVDLRARGDEILDQNTALMLAIGAEEQKRAYMAMLQKDTDASISLHAVRAPRDSRAAALALTTILRRKGRVLDAMTDGFGTLRRRLSPEDRALLDKLASVEARLGAELLRGAGGTPRAQHADVRALEAERQALEAQVSARSAEFRSEQRKVTLAEVQAAIPEGAALVEIAIYAPFDEKARTPQTRRGEPRYAAYVLKRRGDPAFLDLGEASPLDAAAAELRAKLADPTLDPRPTARALDARLMQPLRALLGETPALLLSPDGALNLLPFGALIDERGRYLLETTSFTYLASGRELVRPRAPPPADRAAVVLANPAFGPLSTPAVADNRGGGRRSVDMASVLFPPLPGTAVEGRAIGAKLAGVKLLTGAEATEGAVKALRGPSIVHIATHGFFLPSPDPPPQKAGRAGDRAARATRDAAEAPVENPLLRAGLAFAGANQRESGGEDGVLTALEASSLDLRGTELIVLSACETGVGEAARGEGVYGLRRALSIAGAETQVMSLWKVDDDATRSLMVRYYEGLTAGGGRSESMRRAQLALLGARVTSHPYYWASFVVSGEGGKLAAVPGGAEVPRVAPGAHGCGCAVAGERCGAHPALVFALAAGLVTARRRRRRKTPTAPTVE